MEYYEVAAEWWANKLRNVSLSNFDNGDDSFFNRMAMILAASLAVEAKTPDEAIDLFQKKLADTVKKFVESHDVRMILSVDYGPDHILSKVAEETGVGMERFPWKTTMWISQDKVSVSAGYAAPVETLFQK